MKNYFALFLIALLALSACKTRPPFGGDADVLVPIDTVKDTLVIVPVDTIQIVDNTVTIVDEGPVLKASYTIAVILPLMEDSMKSAWNDFNEVDYNKFEISSNTEKSLAFIEGMIMASEQVKLSSEIELKLFDSKGTAVKTQMILSEVKDLNPDLIVGGMNKQSTKRIAEFAKENEVPFVSPFLPSMSVANNNPYYLMCEPSIYGHLAAMANHVVDKMPNAHIKVLYPDKDQGIKYAAHLSSVLDARNDSIVNLAKKINYSIIEIGAESGDRKNFNIAEYLDMEVTNAVFIPSFTDGFIHSMMTDLNGKKDVYDIVTFGMPNWEYSPTIRLAYFNSLALHVTNSTFPSDSPENDSFKDAYKSRYGKQPTNEVYYGYDLFDIILKELDDNGSNFINKITSNSYEGLAKAYSFAPVLDENKEIQRMENAHLFIYKFEDYKKILQE